MIERTVLSGWTVPRCGDVRCGDKPSERHTRGTSRTAEWGGSHWGTENEMPVNENDDNNDNTSDNNSSLITFYKSHLQISKFIYLQIIVYNFPLSVFFAGRRYLVRWLCLCIYTCANHYHLTCTSMFLPVAPRAIFPLPACTALRTDTAASSTITVFCFQVNAFTSYSLNPSSFF